MEQKNLSKRLLTWYQTQEKSFSIQSILKNSHIWWVIWGMYDKILWNQEDEKFKKIETANHQTM